MAEAKRFLHFNSCVYEMTKKEEQYNALIKQKNNPIIFESVFLGTVEKPEGGFDIDTLSNQLFSSLGDMCTPELMENRKIYSLYPVSDPKDIDTDFIVVYGIALEDVPVDLYAPIATSGNPEDNFKAIERALQPRYKRVLTMILAPMTGKFMFDLSISDISAGAITVIDPKDEVAMEEIPEGDPTSLTLDPTMPTLSAKDKEILAKFDKYIDDMRQSWIHSDMTMEEAEAESAKPLDVEKIAEAIEVDVDVLFDIIHRREIIAKEIASNK